MVLDRKLKQWLGKKFRNHVKFDEPMSKHTSLNVGGPADAFITAGNRKELSELVHWAWKNGIDWFVVGNGTNLLVSDKGIRGIVVILTDKLEEVIEKGEDEKTYLFKAAAGGKIQTLCRFAIDKGAAGINFAIGIPGSIGGAIAMNAGTSLGSMGDIIESVTFLCPDKAIIELGKDELDFKYRELAFKRSVCNKTDPFPIILEGLFRLKKGDREVIRKEAEQILKKRKANQPVSLPNAGCFFKNPETEEPAGKLIELAGLKGSQVGGARISERHANFIVNTGNASAKDFLTLMETVKKEVYQRFNVKLEPEVKIAG